jgi:hypothetical protein
VDISAVTIFSNLNLTGIFQRILRKFGDFILIFYFRATCLFSSFLILSTKVICKAATDLLRFLRRLTRRKTIMLDMQLSLSWKENFTYLEDCLTATRYCFVEQIKIIKSLKTQLSNLKIISRLRDWTAVLLTSFRRDSTKNENPVTRHFQSKMARKVKSNFDFKN